ncbi:leukosialin-like [Centropristis striata]|uniref:leukosialin-like n=1 Tax=Centropristis striata TaxID=184440 RepID=UPI0027E06CAE|nr:leukosialin-like [Centropristis striata]
MSGSAFSETPGSGPMEAAPRSETGRKGNLITGGGGRRIVQQQISAPLEDGLDLFLLSTPPPTETTTQSLESSSGSSTPPPTETTTQSLESSSGSSTPPPTETTGDLWMIVVVSVAVIITFNIIIIIFHISQLALMIICYRKVSSSKTIEDYMRKTGSPNMELYDDCRPVDAGEDSTYESIDPVGRDQDQIHHTPP